MKCSRLVLLGVALAAWLGAGCATVNVRTHPYLGGPTFAPSDPARVQILTAEPNRPKDRLGEIVLSIQGNPSRETLEKKLRKAGAEMGADAVIITQDQTHLYPVFYGGWWGGGVSQEAERGIVAVAVKFK